MPPEIVGAIAAAAAALALRFRGPSISTPSPATILPVSAPPAGSLTPAGGEMQSGSGLTSADVGSVVRSFAHPAAPAATNPNPSAAPAGLGASAPYVSAPGMITLPGMGTFPFQTTSSSIDPSTGQAIPMAAGSVYVAGIGEVPGPVPQGATVGLAPGTYTPGGLPVGAGGVTGWAPGVWTPTQV